MVAPARLSMGSKNFHDKLEPYIAFYYFHFPKKFLDSAGISRMSLYFDSVNSNLSTQIFNFDQVEQSKILSQFYPKNLRPVGCLFLFSHFSWRSFHFFFISLVEKNSKKSVATLLFKKNAGAWSIQRSPRNSRTI